MPPVATTSFPWTGTSPGQAGPYSAAQFAAFMNGLYARGADVSDQGVLFGSSVGSLGTSLPLLLGFGFDVAQNSVANMSVNVDGGTAVVNGTWVQNLNPANLAIAANVSGNPRIDTAVIHLDYTLQTSDVRILQGTPAGSPNPPGLTQSALIWEIPLADIAVPNGAASILQAAITPRTVYASAPDGVYLTVKNNSGGTLVTGDVVVWDNTSQQSVKAAGAANDPTVAGVIVGRYANSKASQLLVKGIGWVNVSGAVSNGQALVQSATPKAASAANLNTNPTAFAYAMSAVAGSGLMPAYVDASQVSQNMFDWLLTNRSVPYVVRQSGANYTTVSATFVDVDAANLIVTADTKFGTRCLVLATFTATPPVGIDMFFDIFSVGLSARAGGTSGLAQSLSNNNAQSHTLVGLFTGLTPGSNQFKLQFRIASGASAGTINNNNQPIVMFAIPI